MRGWSLLVIHIVATSALAREPLPSKATSVQKLRRANAITSLRERSSSAVMSLGPVAASAAIFGAANAVGFGISVVTNWHFHLDLIGTGVFALVALLVQGPGQVQQLSAAAVALWATKLSSFLFFRVLHTKRDARLEKLLSTVAGTASFWCAPRRTFPCCPGTHAGFWW